MTVDYVSNRSSSVWKMTRGVVIGAGLSGLAAALTLQRCGIEDVMVLEKRLKHSRDNHILLSHLGTSRLHQLGAYKLWQELYGYKEGAVSEGAVTRGQGVEELVRQLKESGRLPADAPDDQVRFKYDSSTAEVIRVCKELGLEVDEATGNVTAFHNATPEMVSELQQRGLGIESVKIQELEHAMVRLCHECGVQIIYDCGDITLTTTTDSVIEVRSKHGIIMSNPSVVIDCEGSRRAIAKQQLKLREVRGTTSLWFAMFVIENYYGPVAYTVINASDSDYPSSRLRHFLFADFQTRKHSVCSVQLPSRFVGKLDDDYDGEMLRAYCRKHLRIVAQTHGLDPPPDDFQVTWQPFESRETYVEGSSFGDNVLVIGDAARSGTFLSGTGYSLALACDLNAVEALATHVVHHGRASREFVAELGAAIEATSKYFHRRNLERYY